jgi:hypothetical protein
MKPLEEDAMKDALAVFLSFAALALPGRAAAQAQPDLLTVGGAVVSTGNTSLVIDAEDGTKRTFLVDSTTRLPTVALAPGSLVSVQYRTLDADRAQALNVDLVDPAASQVSTPPAGTAAPIAEQSRGPVGLDGPVPFLGVASLGLALAAVFVWVFVRRRHHEMPHLSL